MKDNYLKFQCPECGHPLEIKAKYHIGFPVDPEHHYEHIELIRHCSNCFCDWTNEYVYEFGSAMETQLRRKFWG